MIVQTCKISINGKWQEDSLCNVRLGDLFIAYDRFNNTIRNDEGYYLFVCTGMGEYDKIECRPYNRAEDMDTWLKRQSPVKAKVIK